MGTFYARGEFTAARAGVLGGAHEGAVFGAAQLARDRALAEPAFVDVGRPERDAPRSSSGRPIVSRASMRRGAGTAIRQR